MPVLPAFTLFDDLADLRLVLGDVAAGDEALTTFLLDAEAAILLIAGPIGEVVEQRRGGSSFLLLNRIAGSISQIVEGRAQPVDLDEDDWVLYGDSRSIERLDSGPNPATRWDDAEVTYETASDLATRRTTAIALIRASLTGQPGVLSLTEGNFTIQYANGATWSSTREDILESAAPLWSFG